MDFTSPLSPEPSSPETDPLESHLHELAHLRLRNQPPDQTLEGSALLEQLVIRLCSGAHHPVSARAEALAMAAGALRRVLVEYAREGKPEAPGACRVRLPGAKISPPCHLYQIVELHELLEKLAGQDARMARVVELRYFGGMSNGEVAEALAVAEGVVKRDWRMARAWLYAQLHGRHLHAEGGDAG